MAIVRQSKPNLPSLCRQWNTIINCILISCFRHLIMMIPLPMAVHHGLDFPQSNSFQILIPAVQYGIYGFYQHIFTTFQTIITAAFLGWARHKEEERESEYIISGEGGIMHRWSRSRRASLMTNHTSTSRDKEAEWEKEMSSPLWSAWSSNIYIHHRPTMNLNQSKYTENGMKMKLKCSLYSCCHNSAATYFMQTINIRKLIHLNSVGLLLHCPHLWF